MTHVRKAMIDYFLVDTAAISQRLFPAVTVTLQEPMKTIGDYKEFFAKLGFTLIVNEVYSSSDSNVSLVGKILVINAFAEKLFIKRSKRIIDGIDLIEQAIKLCISKMYFDLFKTTINPDMLLFLALQSPFIIIISVIFHDYLVSHEMLNKSSRNAQLEVLEKHKKVCKNSSCYFKLLLDEEIDSILESFSQIEFLSYNMEEIKYIFRKMKLHPLP